MIPGKEQMPIDAPENELDADTETTTSPEHDLHAAHLADALAEALDAVEALDAGDAAAAAEAPTLLSRPAQKQVTPPATLPDSTPPALPAALLVPALPDAPPRGAVPRERRNSVMVDLYSAQVSNGELRRSLDRAQEEVAQTKADLTIARRRFLKIAEENDDLRRAVQRAEADLPAAGVRRTLVALLPALDSLDAVLDHLRHHEPITGPGREALEMLHVEWQRSLSALGVQPFDAVGQRFDPARHVAIAKRTTRDTPSGLVVRQVARGYQLEGRLLRSARVVVALSPEHGHDGLTDELPIDVEDEATDIGERP